MKTFKEFANEAVDPYSYSMFDPRHPSNDPKEKLKRYQAEFDVQDEWAAKSPIFKKILQSEIKADPEERYESTNSPASKTRNALIIRHIYKTQEEWEKDLATNPYYQVN